MPVFQNVHTTIRSCSVGFEPNVLMQVDEEPLFPVETGPCFWDIVAKAGRAKSNKAHRTCFLMSSPPGVVIGPAPFPAPTHSRTFSTLFGSQPPAKYPPV